MKCFKQKSQIFALPDTAERGLRVNPGKTAPAAARKERRRKLLMDTAVTSAQQRA